MLDMMGVLESSSVSEIAVMPLFPARRDHG
ncbi:hypothetical protein V1288_000123 [Bradyrhizobium sp. AZCC 2176]